MGDYLRKCERSVGEMAAAAATEIGGGIIKMRAVEEEVATSSGKRRKVDDCDEAAPELQLSLPANTVSASTANSTTTSSATDVHKEKMRSTDLKHKDSETEIPTFIISQFSRETSPSSEICGGDSEGEFMESISSTTTTKKEESAPRNSQQLKSRTCMPSAAEIEEFFAAAEKREQKRFAEKYNYDVVKDVPLEGRYEWIPLKP